MKSTVLPIASCVSALLAASASAQSDGVSPHRAEASPAPVIAPSTPSETKQAWAAFVAEHGSNWSSAWNEATDTPEHIWGPGLQLSDQAIMQESKARNHAQRVLKRFDVLLGTTGSTLVEDTYAKVRRVHIFGYRQTYRGLPVISGRATVMINDVGVLALFGSHALQIPQGMGIAPRVGRAEAFVTAHRHLALPPQLHLVRGNKRGRLVVWGNAWAKQRTPVRLAWEIAISRQAQGRVGRVYVDAQNGNVLHFEDDVHQGCLCGSDHDGVAHDTSLPGTAHRGTAHNETAEPRIEVRHGAPQPKANVIGTIRAWTNTSNNPNAALSLVPMRNVRVTIAGGGSAFTNASGVFNISHAGTAGVNITFSFRGSRMASMNSEQGTNMTRTIAVTPGTPANITVYASNAAQFDRSQSTTYWATNDVNEFLRARGLQDTRLDGMRVTVNRNQSCNAFYTNFSMTFYNAAGGCVNTAYRSVVYHEFGHGLDHANGGLNRNDGMSEGSADILAMIVADDPIVGQDFLGAGRHIRDARNSLTYPAGGGVHQQGMTWMGWFWDVRTNLAAKLGTAAAVALFRQFGTGIFPANPGSQAAGVRVVFTLDDNDGNLTNGTPNCTELAAACTKRNLPNPANCTPTVPGSYTRFGRSCPGSRTVPSISFCHIGNSSCTTPFGSGNSNVFAIRCQAGSAGATVNGFYLRTQSSNGSTNTIQTYLHTADSAGKPNVAAARTGTMQVRAAYGWYVTLFSSPLVLAPNQIYYIAFANTGMRHPICGSGGTNIQHYWHSSSATAWNGPFTTQPWSFLVRCTQNVRVSPFLYNSGVPKVNSSFTVRLANALQNATAILYTGNSRTQWFSFTLPYDLAPYGGSGCFINSSWNTATFVTTDSSGRADQTINYPNNPALIGTKTYHQWRVLDQNANQFGSATSNSGEGTIGS